MRCFEILGRHGASLARRPDIDMDTPLPEAGDAQVRDIMAEVQPDTVLTFGPDGMTGHVAHMSRERVGDPGASHEVAPPGARAALRHDTRRSGPRSSCRSTTVRRLPPGHAPGDPARRALDRLRPATRPRSSCKLRAIEEHESQVGDMVEAFGEDIFRRAMTDEWFRLGAVKDRDGRASGAGRAISTGIPSARARSRTARSTSWQELLERLRELPVSRPMDRRGGP